METILTQLQQSFTAWQGSSSRKRQSNATLRTQAVKSLDHYSHREVSTAIGVSINTLRSWQKSFPHDQEIIKHSPGFIAMSLDQAQDIDRVGQMPLSLQISLPNGIMIQVTSTNIKSSVSLIVALNKESQPCSI
jgi:hypothetical protein